MEIYTSLAGIPQQARGAVTAIGNFDGVHLGHMALLNRAKAIAKEKGVPFSVLTFEPHPRRLFRPDEPPGRITPVSVKSERLAAAGVDNLISLNFDWEFASQSAESFIKDILIDGLGVSECAVGFDFRFGQLRKGSPEMIEAAGIPVTIIDEVSDDKGGEISSSEIRQSLRSGNVDQANKLLGWNWYVQGEVVRGDQRGRELGYPTANVKLGDTIHPAYGIYAGWVNIEGDPETYMSAINIGIRPMFEIPTAQLEAYLFDFDRDIYGKNIRVQLAKRLRGEAKFDSLEKLVEQIALDCEQAKAVLKGA
jgi:riboflavin kinase/FMN adenylyltransferase